MNASDVESHRDDASRPRERGVEGIFALLRREPTIVLLYLVVGVSLGVVQVAVDDFGVESRTTLLAAVVLGGAVWFLHAVAARRMAAAYRDTFRPLSADLRTTAWNAPGLAALVVSITAVAVAVSVVPLLGIVAFFLEAYLVIAYPATAIDGLEGTIVAVGAVKRLRVLALTSLTLVVLGVATLGVLLLVPGSGLVVAGLLLVALTLGSAVVNLHFAKLYLVYESEIH